MIWVRRALTVPLGLLFLVLLLLSLILLRVNATFLKPGFYKEELEKADVYNFLLDDLLTSGVDELREKEPDFFSDTMKENPLVTLNLTTEDIVSAAQASLPPSWVQEQVEQVLDQAGGYITGERDSFQITIEGAERVKATKEEVKALIRKAQIYRLLFDEFVTPEVDNALNDQNMLPFDVSLTGEDITGAVQRVASEEWVEEQLGLALDEVVAYVVGDQDSFEVNVQLAERADIALIEVKDLLRKANFFDLLFDQVVDPMLREQLPSLTTLPFGVDITHEEVLSALREIVPPEWLQEQVEGIIDEAGPYLTGKRDTFQVVVPLAERREVALTVIEDLARTKFEALIAGLPPCGMGQLPFPGGVPSPDEMPVCIPPGVEVQVLVDSLNIDIAAQVRGMIGGQIPDQLTYTEVDLRQALSGGDGGDNLKMLDKVREVISQGWTYTDADMRRDLQRSQGTLRQLDDVRAALKGGWTYTDVDFRENVGNAGDGDGEVLARLDLSRSYLSRARNLQFLVYVLLGLLLAAIGFLGGRRWWSRLAWVAVTLGMASAIALAVFGPVYGTVSQRLVDDLRPEVLQDMEGTQLLAAEKGMDVLWMVADDFFYGIARTSLILLVIALVLFGASQVWRVRSRESKPPREPERAF
ncbi:MAG: hypothetical protein HW388_1167 [Dehalococcoidia bacterium]|nr:hypothetical protein [Dehalococcoidia bacterium]